MHKVPASEDIAMRDLRASCEYKLLLLMNTAPVQLKRADRGSALITRGVQAYSLAVQPCGLSVLNSTLHRKRCAVRIKNGKPATYLPSWISPNPLTLMGETRARVSKQSRHSRTNIVQAYSCTSDE